MQFARSEATAVLKIAEEAVKAQHDIYGAEGPKLQPDDLVWLEGKNLKTQYPLAKLAPKPYGPFRIDKEIGLGFYKLELPKHMKIHLVFHASLLTPYTETNAHVLRYGAHALLELGDRRLACGAGGGSWRRGVHGSDRIFLHISMHFIDCSMTVSLSCVSYWLNLCFSF
jgi:hypothetical protein